MSFHLRVAIFYRGADEFNQFRDRCVRQLVVRQAFAYGGDIQRSRKPPPIPRQGAAVNCLPGRSCRCTLRVVIPLDNIFEDLKALPPARLEVAADLVHRLKRISEEERQAIFTRTAGALSAEEAGELERVIEEGCEKIDEHGW
jgi:DNA-directed RNA polymerase specialized sigma24 family protein